MMILLEIVLEALPDKLPELAMAIQAITQDTGSQVGCLGARACRHLTNENCITIISEWTSRDDVNRFVASNEFSALIGTRILLRSDPSITLSAVAAQEGADTIRP